MRAWAALAMVTAVATTLAAAGNQSGTLDSAVAALGADRIRSIEYSGSGKWYLFGQEPNPNANPPDYDVSSYIATIDYATATKRVQRVNIETVDPERFRQVPHAERADEYVVGDVSWITGAPGGPATGLPATSIPEPKNVEERAMEIWATPQGFLKAAEANHATSTPTSDGGSEVTFLAGKHKFVGKINSRNEVQNVHTWIDNPDPGRHALRSLVH